MREKLIELLWQWGVQQYIPFHTEIAMLADYLIADGVTIQKWIPSREKLPTIEDADKYRRVLVIEHGMIDLVNYMGPHNYPNRFPCWMPLPEPPKEE